MEKEQVVDKFGKFILSSFRDAYIENAERILDGTVDMLNGDLEEKIQELDGEIKSTFKKIIQLCVDDAVSDFLSDLDSECLNGISIQVEGTDIHKIDDELQNRLYGDESWIDKGHSKYGPLHE